MALGNLPRGEIWVYAIVVVTVLCISSSKVYQLSLNVSYGRGEPSYLGPGWKNVNYLKDSPGYEWDTWIDYLRIMLPWLCGHLIIGQILYHAKVTARVKQLVFVVFDGVAVTVYLGCAPVLWLIAEGLLVLAVAHVFHSQVLVWLLGCAYILMLELDHIADSIFGGVFGVARDDVFVTPLIFALSWAMMRYVSYGVEVCRWRVAPSILDLFSYAFYLPLMITGPVMSSVDFVQQIKQPRVRPTLAYYLQLVIKLARLLLWAVVLEISTHFFFLQSIAYQTHLLEDANSVTLCGYFIVLGISFYVKYLIMYGFAATLARFDFLLPPGEPRCVVIIGSYADMWKYFDRGLHRFVVDYIFIPIGGSRKGLLLQLLASFASFAFIYMWHGLQPHIRWWTLSSFITVALEAIARLILRQPRVVHWLDKHVSAQWQTRLVGVPAAISLGCGHIGVTMLLGNATVGYVFVHRFLVSGWPWLFPAVTCVLYCVVQVSRFTKAR